MNNIGTMIYGYCNGFFGRDDYDDKVIIAEGATWFTAVGAGEYAKAYARTANFSSREEKQDYIDQWSKEEEE